MKNPYYKLTETKELYHVNNYLASNIGNGVKYLFRAGTKENEPFLKDIKKAFDYINAEIELNKDCFFAPTRCMPIKLQKELSKLLHLAMHKIENRYSRLAFQFLYKYIVTWDKTYLYFCKVVIDQILESDYESLDTEQNFYFVEKPY